MPSVDTAIPSEYETEIALTQRKVSGEVGPYVPVFESLGRLPRISQLRSLEALEAAIQSGQTDADRVALTAQYAKRRHQ